MQALREEIYSLTALIESIDSIGDYRSTQKKDACNLTRRLKILVQLLLVPLLEEMKDSVTELSESAIVCLFNLKKAFLAAKTLLKTCHEGSKIYLALESEGILLKFQHVYEQLMEALDGIPYNEFGISEEIKEQVELMQVHLRKAKRMDIRDMELAMDITVVLSTIDERNADRAIIEKLANKLELHGTEDLRNEAIAVKKLIEERGQNTKGNQQILYILSNLKQVAVMEEETTMVNILPSHKTLSKSASLKIPNEFLCPVSLEIMMDPVIVATGQTYERESIERWLDDNQHKTCPKTGLVLANQFLVPNFALKNIISQWSEKKSYNFPEKVSTSSGSQREQSDEIFSLVRKLSSLQLEVQRKAVTEIRMISKESPEKRISIARSGGIRPLVYLLSYPDLIIQEQAVTALMNLSIEQSNKKLISKEEPMAAIIEILQNGSTNAKENSAAAIFSLSLLDENKPKIGYLNGIPPLVDLLQNGRIQGKKDAASALFHLSLNRANSAIAMEAGILSPLLKSLKEKNVDILNETLSLLVVLVLNPDGREEIGRSCVIGTLVDLIKDGTGKNKERAAALLLELGKNDSNLLWEAVQCGVYEHVVELSCSGSDRGQRKANSIVELMRMYKQIP